MTNDRARQESSGAAPFDWSRVYARRLAFTDLLVLVWVVFGVQIAYFGLDSSNVAFSGRVTELRLSYYLFSVGLIVAWMIMLHVFDTRDYRVIGGGSAEYRAIADSTARLFGLVAIVSYLFRIDVARGYILIALPLGIAVLLLSRWMWRQWLCIVRLSGAYSARVVLVGSPASALHIARELERHPEEGYHVVGACISPGPSCDMLPGTAIPVLGSVKDALSALDTVGADTLVITGSEELGAQEIRQLSWGLESGQRHLIVAPSLSDIGGPRIHTRPVAGLPLIHVETPQYTGRKLLTKRSFDLLGASALILAFSPVLAIVALSVKLTSRGPVLYRQRRVGLGGRVFGMLKFRSMIVGAEASLPLDSAGAPGSVGNSVLFKMKDDPRVTRVGRVIRRLSLDELPQLFNVLSGSMSLVGPRPPLQHEVDLYEEHVHRRFLVKPGMTGLWQVSGRSNLSWEDSVRLDLYYVENWSLVQDLVILWRTLRAVVGGSGAY